MVGRKRVTDGRGRGKGKAPAANPHGLPGVYREMLAEALPAQADIPERPLKRRMTGRLRTSEGSNTRQKEKTPEKADPDDEDEDVEFEDVLGGESDASLSPPKLQQTAYRSDEDSGGSDAEWDPYDLDLNADADEPTGDLELTLTSRPASIPITPRRKAVTKVEKSVRLETHKLHLLCLLSYLSRRNSWCNDMEVQKLLKPLLDKKMLRFLKPSSELSQFGQAESVKRGLEMVNHLWRKKFHITERGMRRTLWADDMKDIQNYKLPNDSDTVFDKSDFKTAAQNLEGSRDVGAQLYCALLRSAGVDVRLVSSLQPLSFNAGGPSMRKGSTAIPRKLSDDEDAIDMKSPSAFGSDGPVAASYASNPRRRLGHPHAADYQVPEMKAPRVLPPKPTIKPIVESPYPIFWVEVFDEAHQKWFSVDPLVTDSIAKPRALEPPASDRENSMTYVIAFEDSGCAKDVTRRYAKAFNAKTRRNRVDSTTHGAKWWRKTMRVYERGWISDIDQIEETELNAIEAREPMPKNIADFKDHPTYALERHLRRNEVLVRMQEIGKVAAGRDPKAPGGKRMESVYRRRDIKVGKSADAWYRVGREVKMGEQPIKVAPPKVNREDDEDDDQAGINLYSVDQTEIYQSPPIVNGRVPKNSFGNLDVFVSSMVPAGGVHIKSNEASRAARILGIDYSDALTGFEFRGRHGTAVLKGVVVAIEYQEAIEAIIEGFRDEQVMEEERERSLAALKMWRHFLMSLRIKRRIDGYGEEGEEADNAVAKAEESDDGAESEEYSDYGGGGFIPE